jgi:hypothetical protein
MYCSECSMTGGLRWLCSVLGARIGPLALQSVHGFRCGTDRAEWDTPRPDIPTTQVPFTDS